MSYRVYLDANFHQMDTSARNMAGEYASYDEARTAARELIDGILESEYRNGISAEDLLHAYVTRGEEPFIIPDDEQQPFNGRDYAGIRCQLMCK